MPVSDNNPASIAFRIRGVGSDNPPHRPRGDSFITGGKTYE